MPTSLKQRFAYQLAAGALTLGLAQADPVWADENKTPKSLSTHNIEKISKHPSETFNKWEVTANPLLPWEAIWGIGGLALLFGAYSHRKGLKIAIPYTLASGLIVITLINPTLRQEDHEKIPAEVIIAVDKSDSQTIGTRTETTNAALQNIVDQLSRINGVNTRIVNIENSADNEGTLLFDELKKLRDIPEGHVGGIFLLTDGQIRKIPTKTPFADKVPIHALITGHKNEQDRAITVISTPPFALVDETQTIKFRVDDFGDNAENKNPVKVTITNGDKIISERYDVIPGEITEAKIKIPHAGNNTIGLEVEALNNEITHKNNKTLTEIQGIREDLNVLLISGTVNKNLHTLRDFFKSDPDSNLIHFSMMRLPRDLDDTPRNEMALSPFPLRDIFGKTLENIDLVIFDSYENYRAIPSFYMKRLDKYVEDGGAILNISGPEYAGRRSINRTNIGKILPTRPSKNIISGLFRPQITKTGNQHPVTRDLPGGNKNADEKPSWGPWNNYTQSTVKSGHSLLESENNDPILVLDRRGKGRVATLLSDSLWLWQRGFQKGGPNNELIRRISHWLMKNPVLEEEALTMRHEGDKIIITRQTLESDLSNPAIVETPSGEKISIGLQHKGRGIWQAEISKQEQGLYKATHPYKEKTLTTFTSIDNKNSREFNNVISTTELLRPIIKQTSGNILRITETKNHLKDLQIPPIKIYDENNAPDTPLYIKPTNLTTIKGVEDTPLIPPVLAALIGLGLIAGGWIREGNKIKQIKEWWKKEPQKTAPTVEPKI